MRQRYIIFKVIILLFLGANCSLAFDGDLDKNGVVNIFDAQLFSNSWLNTDTNDSWPIYDLYDDDQINFSDFAFLAKNWLDTSWWSQYSTPVFSPQGVDLSSISPMVVISSGFFGGWYGSWYLDDQYEVGYAQWMWNDVGLKGSKRAFYYDLQMGQFCAFFDANNQWAENRWTIPNWNGTPGTLTARWFGFRQFMEDPVWSPFDTAEDYNLPPFTDPFGAVIPDGQMYEYIAAKDIDGNVSYEDLYFWPPNMTDQKAADTGLDQISTKVNGYWKASTQWRIDEANTQFFEYVAKDLDHIINNIPEPDGIHFDDWIIVDLWYPITGAFGDFSREMFKDFMSSRFSSAELIDMGITDISSFDITAYIKGKKAPPYRWSYSDTGWSTDLIWNCYKIFKAQIMVDNAGMLFKETKKIAKQAGRDEFAIYANTIPLWPGAALMKGLVDIPNFEWRIDGAYPSFSDPHFPPLGRYGYVCRLASKIGNAGYSTPNLYVFPGNDGPAHEELHKVVGFEALANRGVVNYNLDYAGQVSMGTDASAKFIDDFTQYHSDLLSHREYAADVGLVFCPWADVAAATVEQMRFDVFVEEYSGWADFLEDTHKQWDILLSTELTFEALSKYKVVLFPSAIVIEDAHIPIIQQFLDSGGQLIVTGETGTRYGHEQNLMPRAVNAFDTFASHPNFHDTSSKYGISYRASDKDAGIKASMESLFTATGYIPTLTTNAPDTTCVNLNRKTLNGKTVLTLDLNNNNLDYSNDVIISASNTTFTLKLPDEFTGQTLDVSYVSAQVTNQPPTQLSPSQYSVSADTIEVTVPDFEYYSIIIVQY